MIIILAVVVFALLCVIVYLSYKLKQQSSLRNKYEIESYNFKLLCDLINAPIWFKDTDLKLTWVNQYYAQMFDRAREELYGLTDNDIAPRKLSSGYTRDDKYILESRKVYKYKENEKAGLWFDTTKFPLINEQGVLYGIGGIAFNCTAVKKSEMILHNLVHNDYLTGVSNRLFLSVEVAKRLNIVDENKSKLALILLDIDNFKTLNELYGHVVGDEVLKLVADRLKRFVSENNMLVGRLGGDEFVVAVPDFFQASYLNDVVEKLKNVLHENFSVFGSNLSISISMGIGIYPNNCDDYESLIRQADLALSHAKSLGSNSVMMYSEEIGSESLKRAKIESKLSEALQNNEFYLCYQPKLSADGSKVVGLEALARWQSKDFGPVSPVDFIPVAEQSNFIIDLGDWVLRTAMIQNINWKHQQGFMIPIAVNLSVRQIQQANFLDKLQNLMEELNYPPEYLELELTEGMLSEKREETKGFFEKLRALGVKISIDDFGTGYSNLGYLSSFPLDTVKIDRRFITNINATQENQKIVNAIIQLAASFNLSLVAEGVETDKELSYLHDMGINVIQGFFFSRPLMPNNILDFTHEVSNGKYKQSFVPKMKE